MELTKTPSQVLLTKFAVALSTSPKAWPTTVKFGVPRKTVSTATSPDTFPRL